MKKLTAILIITAIVVLIHVPEAMAQITVSGSTGANGNYTSLTNSSGAFQAINGIAQTDNDIIITITGNSTSETGAYSINAGAWASLAIYPSASGLTISGDVTGPLITLNGADFLTLDGRVNRTGTEPDLTISNSSTGSHASALKFITSAENNIVKYCNVYSSCYSTGVGMITFTSSVTGNGNDNNIIEYCNITNAGGNRPICAIFSSGSTGRENSGNIIRNNNIYNFFNPNNTSYGINISNSSTDWTITNNSFYETTTFAPAGDYKYYPLFINTGNNNIISNNYIGGSEPLCAGSAFTVISNSAHYFCGIFINGGTAATVQNNIIRNMNYTSVEDNPWDGIFINSGNIGVIGNTIGATTGTGSIVITTPVASATTTITAGEVTAINLNGGGSGYTIPPVLSFSTNSGGTGVAATAIINNGVVTGFNLTSGGTGYTSAPSVYFDGQSTNYSVSHGMIKQSSGTVTILENNIGSITTVGSADRYSHGFEPIYVRGVAGTLTISNNLIGSLTTENSIHASSTAAFSLQKQDVYGIYSSGTGTTTISGNTIANLHNAYSGINSGARARGILTTAGSNTVQNNTIRNISSASGQSSYGSSASVIGISQTSATAGTTQKVTGNTIYGLSNTNTTYVRVDMYGMYFAGPTAGTHEVSGNFVHSLSVSSPNVGSDIDGIVINSGSVVTCANNIVNLGENIALGYKINGIWDGTLAGNTVNFYFNTVYIGGTVTSGVTSITSALNNVNNTSIRNYRNNILYNSRSGGTTGKHYAIVIAGVAGLTIDYNDYFFAGPMLGKIGTLEKADLIAWKAGTGQDINSLGINPGYTLPGGTSAMDYSTSATLPGISGTGITVDYNGNARSVTPKMGALEFSEYVWQGNISDDFGTASNWAGSEVPPYGADISFAADPSNHCVLDQNRTLGDITNSQGTDKMVVNGMQLTINGNLVFSGGARIDATAASSKVVFAGITAQQIPSGSFVDNAIDSLTINNLNGLTLNGDFTINKAIALIAGNFAIGPNTLTFNGIVTDMTGTVTGGSSTNMIIGGTGSSISMPAFTLNNLTIDRANGVNLYGDVTLAGTLTLTNGTLTVGSNTLTISGNSPVRTNGNIDASNAGATLVFSSSSAITLPASFFSAAVNNLTINTTGGVTASSDFTIDGLLSLQSVNPSETKGSLDMWDGTAMKTLTMGANAVTTGIGDVTGIVKRTSLVANTVYSFGSPFTTVTFPNTGILPADWSFMIKIGTVPDWKPGAVKRTYDIIRTGGSGCLPTVKLHYKDTELNGNEEVDLVFWGDFPSVTEYGRINNDITDNWVSLSGNIEFAPTAFGEREWSLAEKEALVNTWNGSSPTDGTNWNIGMNWTNGIPVPTDDVLIPAGCVNYPTLPENTTINTLSIETGATVNGGSSTTLTLNGGNSAWYNRGTFNPETSTIIFSNIAATISGETDFFNLGINSGAVVTLTTGNIIRISANLVNNGVLDASEFPNTVEYTGGNQNVIIPNGATPGYHHLILSGNEIKTLPATAMSVFGDFTISGTTSATGHAPMFIGGNLSVEPGAVFITGAFDHHLNGNIANNGTFIATPDGTIIMSGLSMQSITGESAISFANLTINNSNGVTLLANITIGNALILSNGNLSVGESTLGIYGTVSKTAGYLEVTSLSSLSFGGSGTLTIPDDLFTAQPAIQNLSIDRSDGVSLGNQALTVYGLLTLSSGILNLESNELTLSGLSPVRTNGTVDASDPGATIIFTNTDAITLPSSFFEGTVNNMTINGIGGVTSSGDFTLLGILHLQSENPTTFIGCLDMSDGSALKTLTMGEDATTIGTGDVTGIIRRTTINPEVTYTFGNQYMSAYFTDNGTLPDEISAKIRIGTPPSWRPGAIAREVEIIQSGGSGTKAIFTFHYIDPELNGNDEEHLVFWSKYMNLEYGRSSYNSVENWISLSNVNVAFFPSSWDDTKNLTLDEYSTSSTLTWNGSLSDSWTSVENWTPNAGPSSEKNIIIPDASTTLHSPTLPALTEIRSLTIDAAGILNSSSAAQLTINGGNSAWNNTGGVFNPGTSNVLFTNSAATISGETSFYDVTLGTGDTLWMIGGSTMRIAGTVNNLGVWRTLVNGPTVVEYNGSNQTVVVPNPSTNRYSTLILNGSGAKTMPGTALNIMNDFTLAGTATVTALASLNVGGNFTIGSGTNFTTGSFLHTVGGNFGNDGGTFNAAGSTMVFSSLVPQLIGGNSPTTFNNLTLDNSSGVALGNHEIINGTLTLSNGRLTLGEYNLTLGDAAVAGSPDTSKMIVATGAGECRRRFTENGSYTFPLGDVTGIAEYSPLTLSFTSGSYTNAYAGVRVTNAKHPNNASVMNYLNRYWSVSTSGISSFLCNVTASYPTADIVGNEAGQKAGKFCGTLPWIKYSVLSNNTLTSLDNTTLADFTGITSAPPVVTIAAEPALTVCENTPISLTANPSGDPGFTFLWNDPGGSATQSIEPNTTAPGEVIYSVLVTDGNGQTSTNQATVTVNALQTISGAFTYYNTVNTPLTGRDITVKLYRSSDLEHSEQIGSTVTTDASGYYEFTGLCPECDYDIVATSTHTALGSVNTTDAAQANSWGPHPYLIERVRFNAADVGSSALDPDFTINASDAGRIQRHFVYGYDFDNAWRFWKAGSSISANPATDSYPKAFLPAGSNITVNFYGLCTGDFNRSFNPLSMKSASNTLTLSYTGTQNAGANQEFELAVKLVDASLVGAVSLILKYPDDLVEVQDVLINSTNGQLDWSAKEGELRIGWNSLLPLNLPAGSDLMILKMKTSSAFTSGNTIRLALSDDPMNELADDNFNIIGNASLTVEVIHAPAVGIDQPEDIDQIILGNKPNPFSDFTRITYILPFSGEVLLQVKNSLGGTVNTLVDETRPEGVNEVIFNNHGIPPGLYFATLRLKSANNVSIRTIKLICF